MIHLLGVNAMIPIETIKQSVWSVGLRGIDTTVYTTQEFGGIRKKTRRRHEAYPIPKMSQDSSSPNGGTYAAIIN